MFGLNVAFNIFSVIMMVNYYTIPGQAAIKQFSSTKCNYFSVISSVIDNCSTCISSRERIIPMKICGLAMRL